jgi:hypothetical protein
MSYKLESLSSFEWREGVECFVVESPVETPRTHAEMRAAIGNVVNIDGVDYEPVGFDMHMLACPVRVGEKIAILVKPADQMEESV